MSEAGRKGDGFSSDYWRQEKERHKFSKPQNFSLVCFRRGQFLPFFWGLLFVCVFSPPVPSIYFVLTDNTPVIHWISWSTASVFEVPMCLQEGSFWHFKSCCFRSHLIVSKASYRSRLQRSKKLNIYPPSKRIYFIILFFRDLSLPLPSSIRPVKKICFKHVTGMISIRG